MKYYDYFMKILLFVLLFVIIFFTFTFIKKQLKEENFENNQKLSILHLVLYSENDIYNRMYNTTRQYYKKFKNVKTIYYVFSNEISEDYLLSDDILYIKGEETFVPGILDKTVKAFMYFEKDLRYYDYIVRSNISTIINFDLLNSELLQKPVEYSGGMGMELQWIDKPSGIIDETWFGTKFISGTAIIFSRNALRGLIQNYKLLRMDIIDDVSIAILFKHYFPDYVSDPIDQSKYLQIEDLNGDYEKIDTKRIIFYRNRNVDRNLDCIQMEEIVKLLN